MGIPGPGMGLIRDLAVALAAFAKWNFHAVSWADGCVTRPFLLAAGRRAYAAPQAVKALSGLLVAGTTAIAFSTDPSRRSDDQTSNSSADASQRLGRFRPAGWRVAFLRHRNGRPFSSCRGRTGVSQ